MTKADFTNLTPHSLRCTMDSCPTVFEKPNGDILIIGTEDTRSAFAAGAFIGTQEYAVSIPRKYLLDLARKLMDDEAKRPTHKLETDHAAQGAR